MEAPLLTVAIAVQDEQDDLSELCAALDVQRHGDTEFLFCYGDARPARTYPTFEAANVSVVTGKNGNLVPQLWRDGLLAARSDFVALTNHHCIPTENWVDRALALEWEDTAAIGGLIRLDKDSDNLGAAIYLQRYARYAPPQSAHDTANIAADNAVYRREAVLAEADLLQQGFWEPSFHSRFIAAGWRLKLDPELVVKHRNRYSAQEFFRQRVAHGRNFGLSRALANEYSRRLLLVVLSPILPLVFLRKIVLTAWQKPNLRARLFSASPWLLYCLAGWGLGEALGYLASLHSNNNDERGNLG